ncbi:undecaprenyl-diphosphate phosphatase [Lysobacter sp. A289]
MSLTEIVILALLQGLTEFLPVSSAAHLILVPLLTGWEDQGQVFDLALHLGSLAAVLIYFKQDVRLVAHDWAVSVLRRRHTEHSRLGWAIVWGTIPVGVAGLAFRDVVEGVLRTPETGALVMAGALIVFGLLLGLADWRFRGERNEHDLRWTDVLVVGLAQALALIPGTSRSGVTMTAALFLGFSRDAAARFSFLLSIPVIVLACMLQMTDLLRSGAEVDWRALALGTVLSGISAFLCIHYFLIFIRRIGMQPFVGYRIVLGVVLLVLFL